MKNKIILFSIMGVLLAGGIGAGVWFLVGRDTAAPENVTAAAELSPAPTAAEAETAADPTPSAAPTAVPTPRELSVAPSSLGGITVTALNTLGEGIAADTSFLIKTLEGTTQHYLFNKLNLQKLGGGTSAFTLQEQSATEFLLTPKQPLEIDTVYTLQYTPEGGHPLSFAYQTEAGFCVESTLPAPQSYSVPVSSGIEITFSVPPEGGIQDYFTIRPAVGGRWEQTEKTFIFIPDHLDFSTEYTITLQGGEDGPRDSQGRTLENDHTLTFTTEWTNESQAYAAIYGGAYETFLPGSEVFVEMNVSAEYIESAYTADVYTIPTAKQYLEGAAAYTQNGAPPPEYTLMETFTSNLSVTEAGPYQKQYFLPYGQTMEPGYYLFDIRSGYGGQTVSLQKWVQVSELSVFAMSAAGSLTVWVNDTVTGLPLPDALVRTADANAMTDGNGVAVLSAAEAAETFVFVETEGRAAFAYHIDTYAEKEPEYKFYSYFYTDRSAYLPDDTIHVFGAINALRPEYVLTANDRVTLTLGDMLEVPVTLDEYGAFEAAIDISGWYGGQDLQLRVNGESVTSHYLSFTEYERDQYILEAASDRLVYWQDEAVNTDISVTTFDGAPVEGVEISGPYETNLLLTTDALGQASGSFPAKALTYNGYLDWRPEYHTQWFNLLNSSEYGQEVQLPIYILPSTVMLEHEVLSDSSIAFTASAVNRDAIETAARENDSNWGYYMNDDPNLYRGAPADIEFFLTICQETTIRTQTGEYYDFIRKQNVPQYDYETQTTTYEERRLSTQDGRVTVTGLPVSGDPMVRYYVQVYFIDKGSDIGFTINLGLSNLYYNPYEGAADYSFALAEKADSSGGDNLYQLRVNETRPIQLMVNSEEDTHVTEGRVLLLPVTDRVMAAIPGEPAGTDFTFLPEYISSVQIFGAYFNGQYVYPIRNPLYISYDQQEMELHFETSFNQESYAPGDEVTATIHVTDNDGNPVQAQVNASVVDEAVLRQNMNDPYFLSGYYGNIYNNPYPYQIYASYDAHTGEYGMGGAEMGGDGDYYVMRNDFNDNPAFLTTETGADGRAVIKFTLSDAVTSWRVTLNGISQDGQVGDDKVNITAGLPIYMDLVMAERFLSGDETAVLVRPRGEAFQLNKTIVQYKAELWQNEELLDTQEQEAAHAVSFNLGARPAGEYTVCVYASAAGEDGAEYTDAMEETIQVVEDDIRLSLTDTYSIDAENPAATAAYDIIASPVSVLFTNGDIAPIMKILHSCLDNTSNRTDNMAAAAYANAFWRKEPGQPILLSAQDAPELEKVLVELYEGVPELSYGHADLFYTARFVAAFPELISRPENMTRYARNEGDLYNENGAVAPPTGDPYLEARRAAGYFALAALNEPVLLEIYRQVDILKSEAEQTSLSDTYEGQRRVLLYAAALTTIGDDSAAAELLSLYPLTERAYAVAEENQAETELRRETLDALWLYVAADIDPPAAFEALKTKEEPNAYVSDICERVNFLKKAVPVMGTTSEVQYTLGGKTETARLTDYDCLQLSVTAEQYAGLDITYVSGHTSVAVAFTGAPSNLDPALGQLEIAKTITPVDGYDNVYRISLTLQEDPLARGMRQYYTIYDRVPSHMRYTRMAAQPQGTVNYYTRAERQQIEIWANVDGKSSAYTFEYYAVKVSDAEAVIPKAYISNQFEMGERWGSTK